MERVILKKQIGFNGFDLFDALKNKSVAVTMSIVVFFIVLNTVKITLFDYFLIQKHSLDVFSYKLGMTALSVIIIIALTMKFKSRIVFVTIYILQTLYIVANISYYLYFHNYLHLFQAISLLKEAFSITRNSAVPVSPLMLIVFIDMPFFIYLAKNYYKTTYIKAKLGFFIKTAVILSLCFITLIESFNYSNNKSLFQLAHDTFSGESPVVERYGTIADNLLSLYQNSNNQELIKQLHYGKVQSSSVITQDKPNFIILQVESMDANIVDQQYNDSYITPYLHSLSNNSIYYPYTLSYHEGGGTSDAEFSIINSVESLQYYPALKLSNYDFPNSMLEQFSKASYDTLAFHGNVGNFYNRDVAFPKLGFKDFFDMTKMNIPESGWGIPDNQVFNFAVDKLKTVQQPFLSYVITMSSHEPFNSARNYYNNTAYDSIQDETVRNYYNSMSYVDQSIKSFVANIESSFKNTYIIIVGDHTPNITSSIYKQASFTMDNTYFEFVPLMIITPGHKTYKECSKVAAFTDIAPTILYASGIKFDIRSYGQNLIQSAVVNDNIPFKGGSYSRTLMFDKVKK
jgi:Phosphoglycerol transferase and related proteins, alkaline phosphatase superfamily